MVVMLARALDEGERILGSKTLRSCFFLKKLEAIGPALN
jgi:hypothetical protein